MVTLIVLCTAACVWGAHHALVRDDMVRVALNVFGACCGWHALLTELPW